MQYQANVSVCYEKATKIFKHPQINNVNDLATDAVQYSGTENIIKGKFLPTKPLKKWKKTEVPTPFFPCSLFWACLRSADHQKSSVFEMLARSVQAITCKNNQLSLLVTGVIYEVLFYGCCLLMCIKMSFI